MLVQLYILENLPNEYICGNKVKTIKNNQIEKRIFNIQVIVTLYILIYDNIYIRAYVNLISQN